MNYYSSIITFQTLFMAIILLINLIKENLMKKILISLAVLFVGGAFAAGVATPSKEFALTQKVKQVTMAEAKALFDGGAVVLDARKPVDIARGKVKGAVRATYKDKGGKKNKISNWDKSKDSYMKDNLPSDKSSTLLAYCNGPTCWKSYKLAVVLANDLGYSNVNWLRDGFAAWKDAGHPVE